MVRDNFEEPKYVVVQVVDLSARRETEEKLRQAQKMEAVGQLTGGIAHDFNNILGVVLANVQLVKRKLPDDERLHRQIDRALDAVRRGADLTKRLLAFSRRQQLEPRVIDVGRLSEELLTLIRRSIGRAIKIDVRKAVNLWPARVDPSELENALLNLCVNARDAMPDGGTLTLDISNMSINQRSVDRHSDIVPGDYVCLSVADTGTGMTEDVKAKIFEPFFTTKEVGNGTGLGMSMVQGFVKQSGGYLSVQSELGVGTTIKIYLPRVDEEIESIKIDASMDRVFPTGTERVLVVDDDEALRQTMAALLDSLGYRVLEADSGSAALELLTASPDGIDLLFTDVVMRGGMNGIELVTKARELRSGLPALIQSGFTEQTLIDANVLDDCTHFIEKPVSSALVAQKLRELLNA